MFSVNHVKILPTLLLVVGMLMLGCGGDDSTTDPIIISESPSITGISPSSGTVGTEVEILGANFRAGATVSFDTLLCDSVDLVGDTIIYTIVPTGVDTSQIYTVRVRNTDGTQASLTASFTPVAPNLQFVNSATKPSGNSGSTVIIEGDAFGDTQGVGQVLFSDGAGGTITATIASSDDWTNSFIVTTVPSAANTGNVVIETATGVSQALEFTVSQNATFSPSSINWTATPSLPVGISGHRANYVPVDDAGVFSSYVLVTGGVDTVSVRSDVNVATIQSNGELTAWSSTSSLPNPTAFHASVATTPFNSKVNGSGYLYCLGGINSIEGEPTVQVYKAPISASGQAGSWVATTPMPVPLHSHGAVVFRSSIYVAGGATSGDVPVATVYRARIDTLGELSSWESLSGLSLDRSYHGLTAFGGYLHLFGGETGAVTPENGNYINNDTKLDEVVYMRIDLRTGDLTTSTWSLNSSTLTKKISKHSSVIAGGNVLVTAGLYNGANTGSSENSYAQIFNDGSVGSFQGATGAITITSQGGGNLFNHAALSYVDADGVAHVMVLGGDDVNNPGAKRAGVWIY